MSEENGVFDRATELFDRVPGYLDTAAVGLPPVASVEAMSHRISEWQRGESDPRSFDPEVDRAIAAYAPIVGVGATSVGIISQVSVAVALVAASLPDGARVLVAEEDFTSVLFPFLVDDRLQVEAVPLADLLDSVDAQVDLVAVSAVQSASGVVTDLDRLEELSRRHQFRTLVDVTQGAGWLSIDASRFDVTACHGYKWLCSPRGAGFITVSENAMDWLRPLHAGWYAGEDPWVSIYGPPLRLADDARRFNTSPAWFSFTGAAPALVALSELGPAAIGRYSVGLANSFREKVGLDPSNSAMVSISTDRGDALAEAGIAASSRAGRARLSFYLYNNEEDVELAASVIGLVRG